MKLNQVLGKRWLREESAIVFVVVVGSWSPRVYKSWLVERTNLRQEQTQASQVAQMADLQACLSQRPWAAYSVVQLVSMAVLRSIGPTRLSAAFLQLISPTNISTFENSITGGRNHEFSVVMCWAHGVGLPGSSRQVVISFGERPITRPRRPQTNSHVRSSRPRECMPPDQDYRKRRRYSERPAVPRHHTAPRPRSRSHTGNFHVAQSRAPTLPVQTRAWCPGLQCDRTTHSRPLRNFGWHLQTWIYSRGEERGDARCRRYFRCNAQEDSKLLC